MTALIPSVKVVPPVLTDSSTTRVSVQTERLATDVSVRILPTVHIFINWKLTVKSSKKLHPCI